MIMVFKDNYMWISSTYDCKYIEAYKIDEYLDTKNCSCVKCLNGEIVLACEDGILNTTENSPDDEKVTYKKVNCLIHTISMVIICLLLLVVISVSCCYYYTKDWIKNNVYYHININWAV